MRESISQISPSPKNYGQSTAFSAGFRHVTGDIVVTMDADRQNDPHDIPAMIKLLQDGHDFVSGLRKNRQDHFIRTWPSKLANGLIRFVTHTKIKDMGCSLKVYRREVVEELYLYGEMHRFISVLVENMGYKTTQCEVNHRARVAGHSKYGMIRIFKVLLDLVVVWFMRSYLTKPMYIFGGAGLGLMFGSTFLSLFVLYQKYALGIWAHKNPLFIIAAILGIISVQFFGLGLICEMLSRTYYESQRKLTYNIRESINLENQESNSSAKNRQIA